MYYIKLNNRKVSLKAFIKGFVTYDQARNALRKHLRAKGLGRNISQLGYSIERV